MSQTNKAPIYMFVFRDCAGQPDASPEQMQAHFQKWMAWIQTMKSRSQYIAGEPLEESPGKVLRGPRGAQATDGPFAEAKEVVGGYMLIAARDFNHAVEISRDCPAFEVGGSVEVRQVMPVPGRS